MAKPRSIGIVACSAEGAAPSFIRPNAEERAKINRIIMDELVYGVFKPEGIAYHQKVFQRMKAEGCDALVLGCTEVPLIMSDSNSPLPTLDSTRLLARAALQEAAPSAPVERSGTGEEGGRFSLPLP